ncbi:MAG: hypothetical protein ABL964_02155 [Steroidobacteraceae bacterium]
MYAEPAATIAAEAPAIYGERFSMVAAMAVFVPVAVDAGVSSRQPLSATVVTAIMKAVVSRDARPGFAARRAMPISYALWSKLICMQPHPISFGLHAAKPFPDTAFML